MSAGPGPGTSFTVADLRPWALVYDPVERRMYEVIELDAEGTIAVILDAGEDYDPRSPITEQGTTRRVNVAWAAGHFQLVRAAPDFTPTEPVRIPATAGTFRR